MARCCWRCLRVSLCRPCDGVPPGREWCCSVDVVSGVMRATHHVAFLALVLLFGELLSPHVGALYSGTYERFYVARYPRAS